MTTARARTKALERLYASLPKIECKRLCTQACGPIAASQLEVDRLERQAGRKLEVDGDLQCSMLVEGKCSAYEARPLICRLFGLVEKMRCPFGCVPSKWLADSQAHHLLGRSLMVGGPMVISLEPTPAPRPKE